MARDYRRAKRCPKQGKIKFGSEKQALAAAARWGKPWMTAYLCPHCKKHHLTGGDRGDASKRRALQALSQSTASVSPRRTTAAAGDV